MNLKIFLGFFSIDFSFIFNIPSHSCSFPQDHLPLSFFQVSELLQSGEKPSLDIVIYFERDVISSSFLIVMTLLLHFLLRGSLLCLTVNARDLSALLTGAPLGPNSTPITGLVLTSRLLSGAHSSAQRFCRVSITILNFSGE